jgi:aryl-alcohol dehydrogenase-like predicted oxidoreductase
MKLYRQELQWMFDSSGSKSYMSVTRAKPILSLGTANFGSAYGLGGHENGLSPTQVFRILRMASQEGFSHLDTASGYENSEQVIGTLIADSGDWLITTKLRSKECESATSIVQAVKASLVRTKQRQFWSVLLHDPNVLFAGGSAEVRRGLTEILDSGLTQRVGISSYSEAEVIRAKTLFPSLSVFQISENVCDQRLATSSELTALASEGNFVFVRSIFLQGLLLMNPHALPGKVEGASPSLRKLQEFCEKIKVSNLELCVGYSKSLAWATGIVFGVNSEKHVLEISKAFNNKINIDYIQVPKLDDWLLDPRNWS